MTKFLEKQEWVPVIIGQIMGVREWVLHSEQCQKKKKKKKIVRHVFLLFKNLRSFVNAGSHTYTY